MSSYYPSFSYLGVNSRDKGLIVAHFDADQGETDTFLGMEPIYTERADGSRLDYGAKYNNVAVFRITIIKQDGDDFSVKEVRENLKWLTGSKKNSPLNLFENFLEEFTGDGATANFKLINTCDHIARVYVGGVVLDSSKWIYDSANNSVNLIDIPNNGVVIKVAYGRVKYSFVCRVTNAWQYKMDARTSGLILEFTSNSPWAYSAKQTVVAPINGSTIITIDNQTDDLYGYTSVNTIYVNKMQQGGSLIITNNATGDITKVIELVQNETVTISNNMMITSDAPNRVFGSTFNFCFPRLVAGVNELVIEGEGNITFEYVYAMKVGDCAMDISVISDPICNDDGEIILDTLPWSRISNTPTTYQGYGITNVYSKVEVNNLLADIQIDETELNTMLKEELS